jgi:NAD(P)-dependent dehydrogenase (short-subunit alcohol dehydrogenase family)
LKSIPLKRLGNPEDVANLAAFLAIPFKAEPGIIGKPKKRCKDILNSVIPPV